MKELYVVRSPYIFNGVEVSREKAIFSVIGIPFDSTSSFRPGSRFAPLYIRLASQSIELFSLRSLVNVEEIPIVDEGDIAVAHGDASRTLTVVENVVSEIASGGRRLIAIGGEHTVTVGVVRGLVRAFDGDICLLCLDAHGDFRTEYLGVKYSHACVMRRIYELLGAHRVVLLGTRALSFDEYKDLRSTGVRYFTSHQVRALGFREVGRSVGKALEECARIYISIDLDVLDPAYAPGVSTPEPEGLSPSDLLDVIQVITDERVVGFDVVEVSPPYDQSLTTSAVAAKIINELIAMIYTSLKK